MARLVDSIANAPDGVMVFTAVLALVGLYFGFSGLIRQRRIEDVPTARVRSAPQGYVELVGTAHAMAGEPIVAPLSQTQCCWFSYRVERRDGKHWHTEQAGTSDGLFLLRDATGDCVIDPDGAEVSSRHSKTWSDHGSGFGGHAVHARLPSLGRKADLVVGVGGSVLEALGSGIGSHRYRESVIIEGDPLYAIGEFRSLGAAEQTASLDDLTAAILREWKQNPATLRERFDSNRDGLIDGEEWERARSIARREAAGEHAEGLQRDTLHTLRRPSDKRHFLIANLDEFALLRRFRWRARLGFAAFVLLGAASMLMVSTRF
jgi:hypothetical protein